MAEDKTKDNKLILHLVRGDQMTAERAAEVFKRVTGKAMSEKGMARLRELLGRNTSE
jgi:hypothetical protein